MRTVLRLTVLLPVALFACGGEAGPQGSAEAPPAEQAAPTAHPEPPPDGPVAPAEPGPAPAEAPPPLPEVPPADAGGWSDPGPATAGDPCPADMVFVAAGSFISGATGEQVELNPEWPDKEFQPRKRHERSTAGYCIDLYEYPNVKGELPWVYVGWKPAKQACASRGRRLCSEDEWVRACGGDEGWLYPYGDEFEPERCNDTVDPVGDESQKAGGGAFPDCVSPHGVYDMEGNVSEWVDAVHELDPERARIVRGGTMWIAVYGHGCMSRHSHHENGPTHGDDGFRCCMDPLGATP
jgi:eukaryotic-like serine/threonine-protein kinase